MLTAEDASNPLVAAQLRTTKAMLEAEDRHRKELAAHAGEPRAGSRARCRHASAT